MNPIPHRAKKFEYLALRIHGPLCLPELSHGGTRTPTGRCPIAWKNGYEHGDLTDMHHRCRDSKGNVAKYPKTIHSLLNVLPVNHLWHMKRHSDLYTSDFDMMRLENWMDRHPVFERWLNDPSKSLSQWFIFMGRKRGMKN